MGRRETSLLTCCLNWCWTVYSAALLSISLNMAASTSQNGIQLLLAAEQEAQHIVNAARTAKQARLKQAKEEAEKEIADFRAQMEADFQRKLAESSGDSGANVKRLELETDAKIQHLKTEASRISPDVVSMLLRQRVIDGVVQASASGDPPSSVSHQGSISFLLLHSPIPHSYQGAKLLHRCCGIIIKSQGNIAKWRKKEGDKVEDADDIANIPASVSGSEVIDKTSSEQTVVHGDKKQESSSVNISTSELPPHIVLDMPALSPTMIEVGDVICEIETDKATLEFESLEEGFLAKILAPEGSKEVAVGQPIAITVEDPNDLEAVKASSIGNLSDKDEKPVEQSTAKDVKTQKTGFNRISPAAKLLILEHGLDASSITASGPRGTLLKGDVLTAIKSGKGSAGVSGSKEKISASPPTHPQTSSSMPVGSKSTVQDTDAYQDLPNSQIRKVIATRLLESKQSTPHLYLSTAKYDVKVSVNDIVIKAVAIALRNVPEANAYWDTSKDEIVSCDSVDISIAVATEKVKELAEKARAGKLKPHEFQGGTFSISNLGMYPVDRFCAIINPPQAGILAVGRGNQVVEPVIGDDGNTLMLTAQSSLFNPRFCRTLFWDYF
ncbi:hypothetical protein DH2020_030123 [Rehmannia glutinosa]|uniref:Dihydrolipoamide acetyltransferase component of pyruvate dehydrogenase complex n=1 Tax=Rehmannia glutinosa TaxID=99300 RepID=A0ABR0VQU7_REHGL